MAAEDLPRFFDRFNPADGALSRPEGLGLGLYITRGGVRCHVPFHGGIPSGSPAGATVLSGRHLTYQRQPTCEHGREC